MITLYGSYTHLESRTIDLRRRLLGLGLMVLCELDDDWAGVLRRRRLWIGKVGSNDVS